MPTFLRMMAFQSWFSKIAHCVRSPRCWVGWALFWAVILKFAFPDGKSSLWFLDIVFLVTLLAGITARTAHRLPLVSRLSAPVACAIVIVIGWTTGMLYELTLSEGEGSFGGFHAETGLSFLMAQGYYVTAALLSVALIRQWHFTFKEAFFAVGAMGIWEVGFTATASGFMAPAAILVAPYYISIYAMYGVTGLLIVDEQQLWSPKTRPISSSRKIL